MLIIPVRVVRYVIRLVVSVSTRRVIALLVLMVTIIYKMYVIVYVLILISPTHLIAVHATPYVYFVLVPKITVHSVYLQEQINHTSSTIPV